jgi:hydrophobe/amphiphile efflux-1 (HAE1) family protein
MVEAVDGVGEVDILGAQEKEIDLTVNKGLLAASGLTYHQVVSALATRNITFPAGIIYNKDKWVNIRVLGLAKEVKDLGDITVTSTNGQVIRIRDVAKVQVKLQDELARARVNGNNACMFQILKQSGGNTVAVAANMRRALPKIQKILPKGITLRIVSDQSKFIFRSVNGVESDILTGALLAIIIVWLFLGNFRSTIITAMALPNSLLGAFFLLFIAGFTVNTMTLLSLQLAIGLLIDDSIVVRENIFRHIEMGQSPKDAALNGTTEVGMAVLSTTLSILAVFIPISFLSGVTGQFFREFGLTVAFALAISLLDAFTSAPMLSAYWYKKTDKNKKVSPVGKFFDDLSAGWNRVYNQTNSIYHEILRWSLNHKRPVVLSTFGLFVFSMYIFMGGFIGANFISPGDVGSFSVYMEIFPGAPLDRTATYANNLEQWLMKQKEVQTVYTVIGSTSSFASASDSQKANIYVDMVASNKRHFDTEGFMAIVRKYIAQNFGRDVLFRVSQAMIGQGSGGAGGAAGGGQSPIYLNIAGPDLNVLGDISTSIFRIVQRTPGAIDINTTFKPGQPEYVIQVDNIKAQQLGITASSLGSTLQDLIQGNIISEYTLGDQDYNIVIRMDASDRQKQEDVRNIMIPTQSGKKVPISAIASFSYSSSPLAIRRENKQRIVRIFGNISPGQSLQEVLKNISKQIDATVPLPPGYYYYFAGQQKNYNELIPQMGLALILALLFIYMILASLYNNFIQPIILMISIPLALIGSSLLLLITKIDIDIYGYIGILLVMGIVTKNAILLIDFTNKKRDEGMTIREALLHAGPIRLRPILMTSFAMIFGMLPMALGLNEGSRGRQALPIAVIGGVLTSTFFTLVVVPVIYEAVEWRLDRARVHREQRKKALEIAAK